MKKLFRSRTSRTFTGLLGGIGEYFNIDPVIIRIIFIFLVLVTHVWPVLVLYILAYLVIPLRPEIIVREEPPKES